MGLLIGCGVGLFALFIGLLILSMIIRAAVWVTNKCVGGSGGRRSYYEDDDDDWDAYDRPARRRRRGNDAIPEPELFKGMGIALLVMLATFVVSFVINIAVGAGAPGGFGGGGGRFGRPQGADPAMLIFAGLFQLVCGFMIWASLLTAMLPTSFPRACLVTVFIYVILILIWIVVFAAVFAVFGLGAMR